MKSPLDAYPCGLQVEPRTGFLATTGTTGSLQLYDALNDRHVRDVQVLQRNYVSGTNTRRVRPFVINFIAFAQVSCIRPAYAIPRKSASAFFT